MSGANVAQHAIADLAIPLTVSVSLPPALDARPSLVGAVEAALGRRVRRQWQPGIRTEAGAHAIARKLTGCVVPPPQ